MPPDKSPEISYTASVSLFEPMMKPALAIEILPLDVGIVAPSPEIWMSASFRLSFISPSMVIGSIVSSALICTPVPTMSIDIAFFGIGLFSPGSPSEPIGKS